MSLSKKLFRDLTDEEKEAFIPKPDDDSDEDETKVDDKQ